MTPHLSLSSKLKPTPHPFNIRTTDGSTMHGHNIGFILISNHSIPRVFHVPNHSYHLYSMGELAELDYHLTFDYSRCTV